MNNPEISEKNVTNPEISEEKMKNPEISEAKYRNIGERKRFSNPEISEENKTNPEISASKMRNPEISERKIANPIIPSTYNPPIIETLCLVRRPTDGVLVSSSYCAVWLFLGHRTAQELRGPQMLVHRLVVFRA